MKKLLLIALAFLLPITARADVYECAEGVVTAGGGGFVWLDDGRVYNTSSADAFDLLTGCRIYASEVIQGDSVKIEYAYTNMEWLDAVNVWVNYGADGAAAFKAMVSGDMQFFGDGQCAFLTVDGKYRIMVGGDTEVFDPAVGRIEPAELRPGYEVFVWVDMVTASRPAQVYPEKIVVIR